MTMPLQEPVSVVVLDEACDGDPGFVDRLKAVEVEKLLLKRPMKSFDDTVTLGTPYEGRRELQTEIVHLPSKIS